MNVEDFNKPWVPGNRSQNSGFHGEDLPNKRIVIENKVIYMPKLQMNLISYNFNRRRKQTNNF